MARHGRHGAPRAAVRAPSAPATAPFGFHETRNKRPETRLLPGARRKPARIPRFSRNKKHETRNTAFFRNTAFLPSRQTADARRRQARRLQGGMYEARENKWKGVFLNPETGITTYTESGFGSRFGIPHYSSVFVGKIRISPCRQSSASAHCRHRLHGCIKSPPKPSLARKGLAKWRGEGPTGQRIANQGPSPSARRKPARVPRFSRNTKHETRNTKHGLLSRASTVGW